jgi:hypothetical protein
VLGNLEGTGAVTALKVYKKTEGCCRGECSRSAVDGRNPHIRPHRSFGLLGAMEGHFFASGTASVFAERTIPNGIFRKYVVSWAH